MRQQSLDQTNTRVCTKCGIEKPFTEYYVDKRNSGNKYGGRVSVCKVCERKKSLGHTVEYKKKHPMYYKEKSKDFTRKTKRIVVDAYGGVCQCCKEHRIEFLAIDHINGGGSKDRKNGLRGISFYRHLIKNNFPNGFRVLCHNCNQSLGKFGYCPHKEASDV